MKNLDEINWSLEPKKPKKFSKHIKWSAKEVILLEKLYSDPNVSEEELEKQFDRAMSAIRWKARTLDLHRICRVVTYPDEEIKKLYENGQSTVEIAKRYNVSPALIYLRLKKMGATLRSISEALKMQLKLSDEIIRQKYENGESTLEIAEQCGCNPGVIWHVLKREEVNFRSPSEAQKLFLERHPDALRRLHEMRRKMPSFNTSIERKVGQQLQDIGIHYLHPFYHGRYQFDFYIPSRNTIVECDGDYWHNLERMKKRDCEKNRYVEECGFNLLRLPEHTINASGFNLKWWIENV